MGSFAIQCDISKEPIYSGDYIYAFYLEPNNANYELDHMSIPLKSMFQYFKLSCLPVYGTYNDYGMIDRIKSESLKEIDLAEKVYNGYDFGLKNNSHERTSEPGLSKNKLMFAVHKSVFEALVKKGKTIVLSVSLEESMNPETIKSMNDEHIQIYKDNLEPFLKSLSVMGHKFKFETKLISSECIDNGIPRYRAHNYLENKLSNITGKDTGYSCAITGRSIKEGEKVKAMAVQPNYPALQGFSLSVFKRHHVGGQFGICSPVVDCKISNQGKFLLENNELFNMLASTSLNDKTIADKSTSDIMLALAQGATIEQRNGQSFRSLMLIPEDVFNLISEKSDTFIKDYSDWKKAVMVVQEIKDISTPESILKAFTDKGFTEYSVKDIIPSKEELDIYNSADEDRLREVKMHMNMMIQDSLNSLHGKEAYFGNEFNSLFSRNEKFISNSLSVNIKKTVNATMKEKMNFDTLDLFSSFLSDAKKLSDGMWMSGIGIFPSYHTQPTTESSDEIIKLINEATKKKVSKDFKRAKKFQEEYGYSC